MFKALTRVLSPPGRRCFRSDSKRDVHASDLTCTRHSFLGLRILIEREQAFSSKINIGAGMAVSICHSPAKT